MNLCFVPNLPLLQTLVEERAGERRLLSRWGVNVERIPNQLNSALQQAQWLPSRLTPVLGQSGKFEHPCGYQYRIAIRDEIRPCLKLRFLAAVFLPQPANKARFYRKILLRLEQNHVQDAFELLVEAEVRLCH